jgi:DnaK suppressor protein
MAAEGRERAQLGNSGEREKPDGMNTDAPPAELRRALFAEKEEIRRMSDSAGGGRRPVELDQQSVGRLSRMDAMQVQAMEIEAERRRQERIRRIDAALQRIDRGEYGACVRCGEEIDPKRLALDLTTPLCAECSRTAPRA